MKRISLMLLASVFVFSLCTAEITQFAVDSFGYPEENVYIVKKDAGQPYDGWAYKCFSKETGCECLSSPISGGRVLNIMITNSVPIAVWDGKPYQESSRGWAPLDLPEAYLSFKKMVNWERLNGKNYWGIASNNTVHYFNWWKAKPEVLFDGRSVQDITITYGHGSTGSGCGEGFFLSDGTVYKFSKDGKYNQLPIEGARIKIKQISANSNKNLLALTEEGKVLHYDGNTWGNVPSIPGLTQVYVAPKTGAFFTLREHFGVYKYNKDQKKWELYAKP